MQVNKYILSFCPNFNRVINADFMEEDGLSVQLVKIYKDFIFKINPESMDDIYKVKQIDKVMGKYVDDCFFRNTIQKEIKRMKIKKTAGDIVRIIIDSIIQIFKKYELEATRKIYISKWI